MIEYDLIVIGAGSGGLVAATTAKRKGLKTALIEKNKIGGECTHYGCVPSKALINAAKSYHGLKKMKAMGLSVEFSKPDFGQIMDKVDDIVQGIYAHETPEVFQDQGIDVYVSSSGAQFIDAHTITIGKETIQSKHFIICTGSSPKLPDLDGIENVSVLHNENFWELRTNPKKIVFIGEINEHENRNGRTEEYVKNFCDIIMGVYFAQKIPYIFYWEIYANETKTGSKRQDRNNTTEELQGNWLIRPDGTHGWAQEYFDMLLLKSQGSNINRSDAR